MVRRRLLGFTMGILGVLLIGSGIVRAFGQPHPNGIPLARPVLSVLMGLLIFLIGLQSLLGVNAKTIAWTSRYLFGVLIASTLLGIFGLAPEERWAFVVFAGVLSVGLIILFTVMHAKGYRWKKSARDGLLLAKEGEKDV